MQRKFLTGENEYNSYLRRPLPSIFPYAGTTCDTIIMSLFTTLPCLRKKCHRFIIKILLKHHKNW